MSALDELLKSLNQGELLESLSKSVGARPDQVSKLVSTGIPSLVSAMNKNAATSDGAGSLAKALDRHADDDTDDLGKFLLNVDTTDGTKILKHVLGDKTESVEDKLAIKTGLKTDQVGSLLAMLAPLLLSSLGKQKKANKVNDSGLGSLLGGLLGSKSGSNNLLEGVTDILDADNDGDMMDDLSNLLGGIFKK